VPVPVTVSGFLATPTSTIQIRPQLAIQTSSPNRHGLSTAALTGALHRNSSSPQLASTLDSITPSTTVRASPTEKWRATNLSGLRFAGVESTATWIPVKSQRITLSWTSLNGAQRALNGLQSEYVFNYPVNNVRATWDASIHRDWLVHNSVQIAQRYQQTAYPVWDLACSRKSGHLRPYLRLGNFNNTAYQEISGVAMPGRSITGGLAILLGHE
jgi:hypothetical protein